MNTLHHLMQPLRGFQHGVYVPYLSHCLLQKLVETWNTDVNSYQPQNERKVKGSDILLWVYASEPHMCGGLK